LDVIIVSLFLTAQTLIALPDTVRAELDKGCAGWRLAPVLPEIAEEVKTRTPSWPANMIPGDFNADKKTDVAVLVECKGTVELVAFLSGASGFTKQLLEPATLFDARQFLHLVRGEYERDAIGVEYEAIGGHAWVFRDGRWQSLVR
jgi:hypothetical protein